ncbi:acyltransferase family protein [Sinorhizobium fredii]|uniref:acyltransferase family protein n=1 Tax=Rhizobium fredii TaxID=380 RepID=UPI0018658A69|nr:acyltransferase [Sinorhizobium fredii]
MTARAALHPHVSIPANRVAPIDTLRCFAMTAVVAQHCGLMPFGWTGVWLFFVISGYVVTLSVIGRQDGLPPMRGMAAFFRRRANRIVPIYYAYVLAGLVLCLSHGDSVDAFAVESLLGFFNNVAMIIGRGEIPWPVGHLWTISVEMQFYVIYGMLLFLASHRTVAVFLVAALVVSPLMRLAASFELARLGWGSEASAYAVYSGPFLHTDAFAMGAILAIVGKNGLLGRIARKLALAGAVLLAAYASVYVSLNFAVGDRGLDAFRNVVSGILWGQGRQVVLYSALTLASGGLVALAATRDPWADWLLRPRLLQRIGEVSYGAYVYHALAIVLARWMLSPLLGAFGEARPAASRIALFVLSYLLTVAAAEVSFRFFESRFLRKKPAMPPRQGQLPSQTAT